MNDEDPMEFSFQDDSLLRDTIPVFGPKTSKSNTEQERNPFAVKPSILKSRYLNMDSSLYTISDDDDLDPQNVQTQNRNQIQPKHTSSCLNVIPPKVGRSPLVRQEGHQNDERPKEIIELIQIDDDDEKEEAVRANDNRNHVTLSRSFQDMSFHQAAAKKSSPKKKLSQSPPQAGYGDDVVEIILSSDGEEDDNNHVAKKSIISFPANAKNRKSPKPHLSPPKKAKSTVAEIEKIDEMTKSDKMVSIKKSVPTSSRVVEQSASITAKNAHIDLSNKKTPKSTIIHDDDDDEEEGWSKFFAKLTSSLERRISLSKQTSRLSKSETPKVVANTSTTTITTTPLSTQERIVRELDNMDLSNFDISILRESFSQQASNHEAESSVMKPPLSSGKTTSVGEDCIVLSDDDDDDRQFPAAPFNICTMSSTPNQLKAKSAAAAASTGVSHDRPCTPIELPQQSIDITSRLLSSKQKRKASTSKPFSSRKFMLKGSVNGQSKRGKKVATGTSRRPQVKQNLFGQQPDEEDAAEDRSSSPPQPPATIIKQADAIRHITANISSNIFEMIDDEMAIFRAENGLQYEQQVVVASDCFEQPPNGDDYDRQLDCVIWRASSQLAATIHHAERSNSSSAYSSSSSLFVSRNSAIFDQLLVVLRAEQIHDYVEDYMRQSNRVRGKKSNRNPLFDSIIRTCTRLNVFNVTVVTHGLERYLRQQRSRANTYFRQRMKQLIANDENQPSGSGSGSSGQQQQDAKKRNRKKTAANVQENSSRYELTNDAVDLCLIDCRMHFMFDLDSELPPPPQPYGRNHSSNAPERRHRQHFGTIRSETAQELATIIYRYSKALSSQVYRQAERRSCVDIYISNNGMTSIDPSVSMESRMALWLRQLQQFPSISSSVAELIVACFPCPRALYEAVRESADPVRMIANAGYDKRRIGHDLAFKLVRFVTTTDPDVMLSSLMSSRS